MNALVLTAKRMSYAGNVLPGVDLRDKDGKLVASCYGHGQEGERVLASLLETFPGGDEVVIQYVPPRQIVRQTIRAEAEAVEERASVAAAMVLPPVKEKRKRRPFRLTRLLKGP